MALLHSTAKLWQVGGLLSQSELAEEYNALDEGEKAHLRAMGAAATAAHRRGVKHIAQGKRSAQRAENRANRDAYRAAMITVAQRMAHEDGNVEADAILPVPAPESISPFYKPADVDSMRQHTFEGRKLQRDM